jgi:DNA-binding transcriptional ArsR family regulator
MSGEVDLYREAYKHNGTRALTCTPSVVSERVVITEGMLVRVADRLRVLGQVVRLRLVEQLRAGEATPQELADTLGLTQQNVSKHLQVLHRSGVVARRPYGANVLYRLADDSTARFLDDVVASVAGHLRELSALAAA